MGASDVAFTSHSRANGCSCPPHGYQFLAWGCYVYFGLFYFVCAVPHLLQQWQPAAYVVVVIFFIIHLVVHVLACVVNPADANVLAKMKKGENSVGTFNRSEHRHVIENQHCYLCEVDVGSRSKHCSTCNKCVSNFDHHCKWLNNCVGGRNYRLFIATLSTAIAGCLSILIVLLLQFTAYYTDRDTGALLKPYHDYYEQYSPNSTVTWMTSPTHPTAHKPEFCLFYMVVPDIAWQSMTMFTAILAALGTGLLGHLLGFHIYLMCKDLTTYDYIVREREKSEQRARDQTVDDTQIDSAKSKKLNKIRPDDSEMQTKRMSRGGIDEYAVMETARLSGETPPPAPTPPPPNSAHSYHLNPATLAQRFQHEVMTGAPPVQRRKKKKKSKRLSASAEYPSGLSHSPLPPSPGNSLPRPANGRLPTLAHENKDLIDRIRRSLEEKEQRGETILSDDAFPPSSIKDVDFAVEKKRKKKKNILKKEALSLHTAASGTDDTGYNASDSGCDLNNGSPSNFTGPVLPSGECHLDHLSPQSYGNSIYSDNSRHTEHERSRYNNIEIERLELPHSSDSDYEGSRCKHKDELTKYSPRGYNASGAVYHTLPGPSSHHHKPHCDTGGSTESLREIPVSNTHYGTRQSGQYHHGYGPEISQAPRKKSSKNKKSTNQGVVNEGAKLEDSSSEEDIMTHHNVQKLTHTVEIYSDRTPRPPRHKDVPPLDLSTLHGDSDKDSTNRHPTVNKYQKAAKI